MLSKHRLKTLERKRRAETADATTGEDDLTAEEWLAVFETWEQDPDYAANEPFMRYLAEYRETLASCRGREGWEPPPHFLPRLPLHARRRHWRVRHPQPGAAGIWCARNGVLVAYLWVHPEDEYGPLADG